MGGERTRLPPWQTIRETRSDRCRSSIGGRTDRQALHRSESASCSAQEREVRRVALEASDSSTQGGKGNVVYSAKRCSRPVRWLPLRRSVLGSTQSGTIPKLSLSRVVRGPCGSGTENHGRRPSVHRRNTSPVRRG